MLSSRYQDHVLLGRIKHQAFLDPDYNQLVHWLKSLAPNATVAYARKSPLIIRRRLPRAG
jgi:hypothetical protein